MIFIPSECQSLSAAVVNNRSIGNCGASCGNLEYLRAILRCSAKQVTDCSLSVILFG